MMLFWLVPKSKAAILSFQTSLRIKQKDFCDWQSQWARANTSLPGDGPRQSALVGYPERRPVLLLAPERAKSARP